MNEGVGMVKVPEEVFQDSFPLWEDFLIGKFLEEAPHIAKIHAIVNKIWALGDKDHMIEVFPINATTMKFRICNSVLRNRVLRRGMWNLADIPVVMSKWSPFPEESQPVMESIPLWVHMKNIPVNMFSWKGLSFAASPLGIATRLHPETAQCLNKKVAKIFVNADLTKELPRAMNFTFHGKETLVEYTYQWLPSRCSNGNKWGHLAKACLAEVRKTQQSQDGKGNTHEVSVGNGENQDHESAETVLQSIEKVIGDAESDLSETEVAGKEIHANEKVETEVAEKEVSATVTTGTETAMV